MPTNNELIDYLLEAGYADESVAKAMRKADRAEFVPSNLRQHAYIDTPLPIGHGQTISAPGIVALMSRLLEVKPGMKVLDVGAGSGYQAAVLAELVGKKGKVITIDRIAELVEMAKTNCKNAGYPNISFIHGDGTRGYPEAAPYDRILVAAAASKVPHALLTQLKEGGKLVIPVGERTLQILYTIDKLEGGAVKTEQGIAVLFVPLIEEERQL